MKPTPQPHLNKEQLQEIKKIIKENSPNKIPVKIIAVTKKHSIEKIKEASKNDLLIIGENKIQETEKKFLKNKSIRKKIELHLIGHLQSNKAKKAVKIFDVIQTVDSKKILKKINSAAATINKQQRIYFQINIGKDEKKKGFTVFSLIKECKKIKEYKNIKAEGIMTILPQGKTKRRNKKMFKETVLLQKTIQKKLISSCVNTSMGMSEDYLEAVKAGATHIRIGRALFGKRKQ
jgi:hypothetical protein